MTRRLLSVVAAILVCSTSVSAQKPRNLTHIVDFIRPAIDKLFPSLKARRGYKNTDVGS